MRLLEKGFIWLLLVLALPTASFGEQATVGTVTALEGDVRVRHEGETQFVAVRRHQEVFKRDLFRTGNNGKAQIVFEDDSMIVLGTAGELEITEYVYRKDARERNALLGLLKGKVRFLVTRFFVERKEDFRVQTSQAVVGVRGTEGIVRIVNPTLVYCLTGALGVQNPSTGESRDLGPLTMARVEPGQPIGVEPIDPKDVQGLRAEFKIGPPSPATPEGTLPLRDDSLSQDEILPSLPKDATEPERQQHRKYQDMQLK